LTVQLANSQLKRSGMQGLVPEHSTVLRDGSELPSLCPECHMHLTLRPTSDRKFDANNYSIVCGGCNIEFQLPDLLSSNPELADYVPAGHLDPGPDKYRGSRDDALLFGEGRGSNQVGRARSVQFRLAVDLANGLKWDPKRLNGLAELERVYQMKSIVGVFESPSVRKAKEMLSRHIQKVEFIRHIKIPEHRVNDLGKLVMKGVREADRIKPTTMKVRRIAVESILEKEGFWPP
jgi:hypothetical protein